MSDAKTILILEDCPHREYRMRDSLMDRMPQFPVRVERTAAGFAAALESVPPGGLLLVALDHDLDTPPDGRDPGDGRDAAAALAARPPECPVVIHSTNAPAAVAMTMTLEDAGWAVTRVVPTDGHRWVRTAWFRTVRRLIVDSARPAAA